LKSKRKQRIAGEDRYRFAEHLVVRWFAAAQIIIVESRQIIMNQRVRVDKFERTPGLNRSFRGLVEHARRFQAKDRPNPFASGKHTVPHRAVDRRRRSIFRRDQAVERGFNNAVVCVEEIGKFHAEGSVAISTAPGK